MSLFRIGLVLAGAIMLLPVEDKRQPGPGAATLSSAEHTPTFCERNPSTCANARDAWALFLRKAEYAMELSARLLREQLARSLARDEPAAPQAFPAADGTLARTATPYARIHADAPQTQRRTYPMDNPSRWR